MASTTGGEENHRLTWAPWPAVDGMEALHSARDRHALPPRTLPWRATECMSEPPVRHHTAPRRVRARLPATTVAGVAVAVECVQ